MASRSKEAKHGDQGGNSDEFHARMEEQGGARKKGTRASPRNTPETTAPINTQQAPITIDSSTRAAGQQQQGQHQELAAAGGGLPLEGGRNQGENHGAGARRRCSQRNIDRQEVKEEDEQKQVVKERAESPDAETELINPPNGDNDGEEAEGEVQEEAQHPSEAEAGGGQAAQPPAAEAQKPRRPESAFLLFLKDFRKTYTEAHGKVRVSVIAVEGGKAWQQATPEQRSHYEQRSRESKAKYAEEKEKKGAAGAASAGGAKPKKKRGPKDPNAPPRPKSAFFFFLDSFKQQRRATEPRAKALPAKVISQIASKRWSEMTADEREPYNAASIAAKEAYAAYRKTATLHPPALEPLIEEEEEQQQQQGEGERVEGQKQKRQRRRPPSPLPLQYQQYQQRQVVEEERLGVEQELAVPRLDYLRLPSVLAPSTTPQPPPPAIPAPGPGVETQLQLLHQQARQQDVLQHILAAIESGNIDAVLSLALELTAPGSGRGAGQQDVDAQLGMLEALTQAAVAAQAGQPAQGQQQLPLQLQTLLQAHQKQQPQRPQVEGATGAGGGMYSSVTPAAAAAGAGGTLLATPPPAPRPSQLLPTSQTQQQPVQQAQQVFRGVPLLQSRFVTLPLPSLQYVVPQQAAQQAQQQQQLQLQPPLQLSELVGLLGQPGLVAAAATGAGIGFQPVGGGFQRPPPGLPSPGTPAGLMLQAAQQQAGYMLPRQPSAEQQEPQEPQQPQQQRQQRQE